MAQSWQEIDAQCLSCHSWQEVYESMITAMTAVLILLAVALIVAIAFAALRDVHDDGYGRRLPPASHPRDMFDPSIHRA